MDAHDFHKASFHRESHLLAKILPYHEFPISALTFRVHFNPEENLHLYSLLQVTFSFLAIVYKIPYLE